MRHFFTFYQNIDRVASPFTVFGLGHFAYISATLLAVFLLFRAYKRQDAAGRIRWQRGFAWYLFIQEMFFYLWTFVQCRENTLFEVLQLELCTACLFVDFSTLFHQNRQARFFGALIGLIGGPIAMIYPATVAQIYPAFSYRLINFFMTHGTYILFSLMLLADGELLTRRRFRRHIVIAACMLTAVFLFDKRFGTQYMFVGTPPEIGVIRMVYDAVGPLAFLPTAIVIFSAYQGLMYIVLRRVQRAVYPKRV